MGLLISVEGGEFTGKSKKIVPGIVQIYQNNGYDVVSSREPGGTAKGEEIREKIFARLREGADALELAKLFFEARAIHLHDVIMPKLGKNKQILNSVVVLDRYADTTRVLQGFEGGVPMEELRRMEEDVMMKYYPDFTFITKIPENIFADVMNERRSQAQREESRSTTKWDEGDNDLQLKRQREYLALPKLFKSENIPRRWGIVDCSVEPQIVLKQVEEILRREKLL